MTEPVPLAVAIAELLRDLPTHRKATMNPAPIVHVEPNPTYPGALIVTVRCPECRREHTHGLPDTDAVLPSHRAAHCGTGDGYSITDPTGKLARFRP